MEHVQKSEKIVPINEKGFSWLEAREVVRDRGGLPSNLLHDKKIMDEDSRKILLGKDYNIAWASDVVIYLQAEKKFTQGFDIVDKYRDESGMKWVFPSECIPEAAFKLENAALLVARVDVEIHGDMVVILPKSANNVFLLSPFMHGPAQFGKVDSMTGIPLEFPNPRSLEYELQRMLFRFEGDAVRPIVRNYNKGNRRDIFTVYDPCCHFKAGYVETE
ncbi:MAG: hypothetical protein ACREBF_00765 [Candidatus Micrarchaeales archaeon]